MQERPTILRGLLIVATPYIHRSIPHPLVKSSNHKARYKCSFISIYMYIYILCIHTCAPAYSTLWGVLKFEGQIHTHTFRYMRLSFFNTLQHTLQHTLQLCAPHCTTLQHTALSDSIFREHTATHCNTMQHTAAHCATLQHTATHCTICVRLPLYLRLHTHLRLLHT